MKYIVRVQEVHTIEVPVDASSVENAIEKAKDAIANGDVDYTNLEYSHTIDSDDWTISNAKTGEIYQ
mgnify:FL=1